MPEIVIPFSGFYESVWSDAIDQEKKELAEQLTDEHGLDSGDVWAMLDDNTDYRRVEEGVAKAYVEAYQQYLNDNLDLDIALAFEALDSPREYNFRTDVIICGVSAEGVVKLRECVEDTALAKTCRKHLTSRSGFISFYDPDYTTWGPIETWDANQLSMLLLTLEEPPDWALLEDMNVGELYEEGLNWPCVRAKLREEQMIAAGEIEPDAREFPTSLENYVQEFCRLNHLKE